MPPRARKTATGPKTVKDDFTKEIDGVEIVLPSLSYLKPGLIRKVRRLGDVDAMYTLFEMTLSQKQLDVIDDMDPDEYAALLEEWRDHSGVSLGGIRRLDELIEAYPTAIAADLIDRGLRLRDLGTDDLTWDDLAVVVEHLPMGSAFDRTVRGADASWQLSELLLAAAVDSLHWLVWSKTKGAKRGTGRPEPIPRPGVKARHERIGTPASIDKIDQLLGWR